MIQVQIEIYDSIEHRIYSKMVEELFAYREQLCRVPPPPSEQLDLPLDRVTPREPEIRIEHITPRVAQAMAEEAEQSAPAPVVTDAEFLDRVRDLSAAHGVARVAAVLKEYSARRASDLPPASRSEFLNRFDSQEA